MSAVVKVLRAQARVLWFDKDGDRVMEQKGIDSDGKPVIRQATRVVTIRKGEQLPSTLAPGELQRLQAIDAVTITGDAIEAAGEGGDNGDGGKADLADLSAASDEELASLYEGGHAPTIKALVAAIGDDADLAKRILQTESEALKGDVRKGLQEQLGKVIEAAGEGGD